MLALEVAALEVSTGIRAVEVAAVALEEEVALFPKLVGKLETSIADCKHLTLTVEQSKCLFQKAEPFLDGFGGFRSEVQVRALIHKTGLPAFPRPKGMPETWHVKVANNGAGMKYVNPADGGTYVRVMPGKISADWPHQRRPYVVQQKHGKVLDSAGNIVAAKAPEAHIPLEEYKYSGDLF